MAMSGSSISLVFTISCCVLLTSPTVTSIDTDKVMEWVSSKFVEKSAVAKEGEGCDASPKLFTSLSYLRSISVNETGSVISREEIETQVKAHQEFYNKKLKTLEESKLSDVTCEDRRLCVNRVCQYTGDIYYLFGEDKKNYKEVFSPEKTEDWEAKNLDFETIWKDLKASLRTWMSTYDKIIANLSPVGSYCNASKEQTNGFRHLKDLLKYKRSGILNKTWPKLLYYGKGLEELTKAVQKSTVFCVLQSPSGDRIVCENGECLECGHMVPGGIRPKNDSKDWEHWSYCIFEDLITFDNKYRKKELDEYNSKLFKEPEGPMGVLSLEEALEWNATFPKTAVLKLNDDCDANRELSYAQKFFMAALMKTSVNGNDSVWRWRTKEELEYELVNKASEYDKAWLLKGLDKTRKMCGDLLVCGPDGLCIPCDNEIRYTDLDKPCFYSAWREESSMVMMMQTTTVQSVGAYLSGNWMNPALITTTFFIL